MSKFFVTKPSSPSVTEFSHSFILLIWDEYYKKIQNTLHGEKILAELSLCQENSNEWKRIYIGYATNHKADNLKHTSKYAFRLRFKVKEEWSKCSEPLIMSTLEPPMTGENLHKAIRSLNLDEIERVLVEGKVNIEAQDNLGFTPLMVAAQKSQTDIMKVLINKGADIEAKTDSGKTALMLACFKGEWAAIDLLIEEGVNLNNTDRSKLTAMHYAVDGESSRAVRILGAAGALIDPVDSVLGWSPLLRCAGLKNNGNVDVAKDLIKLGANINQQDKDGNTPLYISVLNTHFKLCELLLINGANMLIHNKNKSTALKLANTSENQAIRQLFIEAKPSK